MSKHSEVTLELRAMAARMFANHVIEQRSDRHWIAYNPNGCEYWFGVMTGTTTACVYGDVGDLTLCQHASKDAWRWVLGLRWANYEYALGKSPHPVTEWSADESSRWLEYLATCGEEEQVALAKELYDAWDSESEVSWIQAQHDCDAGEWHDKAHVYKRSSLRCYAALCWLTENLRGSGD